MGCGKVWFAGRCSLLFFLAPLLLLMSAYQAASASPDQAMKVWVVAIGVGAYTRNYTTLNAAPDGARKVAQALCEAQPDETTAYILTTDAPEARDRPTKGNVIETFLKLSRNVKPADRVIVYFCGHGEEVDGKSYLLLMDITDDKNSEALDAGSISLDWLREKLDALPCAERLLWLDACRVNSLTAAGPGDDTENLAPQTESMLSAARLDITDGREAITFHGCRLGEKTYYNKDGLPFFTQALVEGLSGKAVNEKMQISMASLADYVSVRVPELAKETDHVQHPDLYPAQLPANTFILRPVPPSIACPFFTGAHGKIITEIVFSELVDSKELNLVERIHLDQILQELGLESTGITDAATAQKLGKLLNADYVLVGSVEDGKKLVVSARLIKTDTGQVMPGVSAITSVPEDDYLAGIQAFSRICWRSCGKLAWPPLDMTREFCALNPFPSARACI